MVTVSDDRDLEDRPDRQSTLRVPRVAPPQAPISPERRTISPEWRTTTRRGAYAAMILALTLGYTWISATLDWGWPLLPSAALLIVGTYVLLTTYIDRLPAIFGRDYVPVDHSTKYTLWFDTFSQRWIRNEDDPRKFGLRANLTFFNGGNQTIQFIVEQFDLEVKVNDVDSISSDVSSTTRFRLLPDRGKIIFNEALGISEGGGR